VTGAAQDPRWRALEIGPGGVPADLVRSIGPDGRVIPAAPSAGHIPASPADTTPPVQPVAATQFAGGQNPQAPAAPWPPVSSAHPSPHRPPVTPQSAVPVRPSGADSAVSLQFPPPGSAGPSAVFGSFDDGRRKPSRKALLAVLLLAVVVAVVTFSSLWTEGGRSADTAAELQPADCLSSADDRSVVVVVDCTSPDAEFSLAAKYANTRDGARCSTIYTDLVLVTKDNTVLCLNYRASVGDCLYAGNASRVGKAPCREPGSSTPFGLYRVVAVLPNTVDVRGCPTGTITSLVHVIDREVLCLGLP